MPERDIDLVRAEQAARNAQRQQQRALQIHGQGERERATHDIDLVRAREAARRVEQQRQADARAAALAAYRAAEAAAYGDPRVRLPTRTDDDDNGGLNWPPAPPVVPPLNVNIDTQWEGLQEEDPLQAYVDFLDNQPGTNWNVGNRFDLDEEAQQQLIAALANGVSIEDLDLEALFDSRSEIQVAFDGFLPLVPDAIQVQLTLLHQEGVTYTYPTAQNLITTEFATPIETLEVDTAHWMAIEEGYQAVVEAQHNEQQGAGARGGLGGGGKQNEILGLAALAVANMLAQVLRALGQYDAAREMMEELKRRANEAVENLLSDGEQIPLGEGDTGGEAVVDPASANVPGYQGGFGLLEEERGANVVTSSDEPHGHRGSPIDGSGSDGRSRNDPTTINGREYSGHALDRMQGRGIPPSAVENAIQTGTVSPGRSSNEIVYTDRVNGVRVVVDRESGRVITVIPVSREG